MAPGPLPLPISTLCDLNVTMADCGNRTKTELAELGAVVPRGVDLVSSTVPSALSSSPTPTPMGTEAALLWGLVGGATALLLLVGAAFAVLLRRRRRRLCSHGPADPLAEPGRAALSTSPYPCLPERFTHSAHGRPFCPYPQPDPFRPSTWPPGWTPSSGLLTPR